MQKDDVIYRQAAIEAIETWGLIDGLSEGQAIEILADEEKVPSVQQAHSEGLYVDGYNNGYRDGIKDAQPEGELDQAGSKMGQDGSSDLISRQAAIDLCDWYDNPSMHDDLEKLPSAQPEPQKWIDHNYYLECPSCKRYVTNRTPYCPYCGGRNE